MERKARLQRLIAEGKSKYIIKSLVIHSIILSIVLTVAGVFGIGSIKGIEWILISMILFWIGICLLYTSPSPRDATLSRMPSSA